MSDDPQLSSPDARQAIGDMAVRAYGKFFLVKKLAEGGMAEIFLAKQVGVEGFEKNVVIKRMLPHLSTSGDFVSMFLDEARLAASLNHPNIVQISDLGLADGCYFICMEYLAGEDFATVLRTARRRREPTPLNIVLRVISEAAVGLHFAHEAVDPKGAPLNLVHRDVSPSNLFITYSGQVKVLDFGIAKAESRITSTGTGVVKGKYQYMSPEQARGDAVDRRSDVFALGVSLYEALTGVRPFARDTDLAVLKAVLDGQYQPIRTLRPDLPLEVEQIVNRAMADEVAHRYPSALALAQDIEKYIGATTSASGGQALVGFMAGFFGPERVKSKTRIESLAELSKRGVDVPGFTNPHSPKTDVGVVKPEKGDATNAIGAPASVQAQARRGKLLIGAALLLGVAGTVVATRLLAPEPVVPVVVPVPPVVPAVVDAGPALVEPLVDAGVVEIVDAGAPAVEAIKAPGGDDVGKLVDAGVVKVAPPKPISLTTGLVQKVLNQGKPRFQKCFRDFKADLPTPQGTLSVNFAIVSSGRVSSVTTSLPGTQVSKCVEKAVSGLTFPRHVDVEVRVPLPMNWDVR